MRRAATILVVAWALVAAPSAAAADPVAGGDDGVDPYFPRFGATGYDVGHYDLDLGFEPASGRLHGTATITLTPDVDLSSFALDLDGLRVSSVTVDGTPAGWHRDGIDLTVVPAVQAPAAVPIEVAITYAGHPHQATGYPALQPIGWVEQGRARVGAGQPVGSSTWFPANDEMADKATFHVDVDVPRGVEAIANGLLDGQVTAAGRTTWSWTMAQPMAPSLASLAVGQYDLVEGHGPHGLSRLSAFPRGRHDLPGRFSHMGQMIDTFEGLFGPYPFDEYGVLVADLPIPYALEQQGRSLFPTFFNDEVTQAHELAHQWFGDSVTPQTYRDIWLNEGFATYSEYLWLDASRPNFRIDPEIAQLRQFGSAVRGPILDPGRPRVFSQPVYYRGALTLHALRRLIGDDDFFDILRTWTADHAGGNVTTEDFIALCESVSGQDLDPFFHAWLEQVRLPPA